MNKKIKNYIKKVLFVTGQFWFFRPDAFNNKYDIIFLFQKYDLSGATKVHLDVVSLLTEFRKLVVFVEYSSKNGLLDEYKSCSNVFVIKKKILRKFYLGMLTSMINRNPPMYYFGMGSPSFYLVADQIDNPEVRIIDIIHAVSGLGFTPKNIISRLHKRIVIDPFTKEEMIKYHLENGESTESIILINNKTYIPIQAKKPHKTSLSILYVGRSSVEKRVNLIAEIAKELTDRIDFTITMIGEFKSDFIKDNEHLIKFVPEIDDVKLLRNHYESHDLLLLVSSREGFPMVIMEAMAHGVVPICTPVGGIPFHIKSSMNGFIIDGTDDNSIIENAVQIIVNLNDNKVLLYEISRNVYEYAAANFSEEKFELEYRELFSNLSN